MEEIKKSKKQTENANSRKEKIMFDKKEIEECLADIKQLKNIAIENNLSSLGSESFVIRILKNDKIYVMRRIRVVIRLQAFIT